MRGDARESLDASTAPCLVAMSPVISLPVSPADLRDAVPVPQHHDAVADRYDLVELRGDEHDRHPIATELVHQLGDLELGTHVDPARRLIEHQQLRLRRQPAGEDRLLLVAAAKQADLLLGVRRRDVEGLDAFLAASLGRGAAARDLEQPAAPGLQDEDDVLANRELGNDAGGFAVLGTEAQAAGDGVTWGS